MQTEKWRYYSKQSILGILCPDANWHNLTFGSLACPNGTWGQVLKERKSIFLKNQGLSHDNTTAGTIEIFMGEYHIDHIKRPVTYSATTGLYTFTTNPVHPQLIPTSDITYLVFEPYGAVTSDVSGRQNCSAVLRNVVNTVGTTYTFTLDGAEIITGTSAIGVWAVPAGGWTYAAATGWHHTTGNITGLVAGVWTPTIGVTYKVVVTNTTTTAGTGFHFSCGAIDNEVITRSGVSTHYFTAESATALTFDLGAGGTWVGNITSVSVSIHDDGVNKMLQNNITNRQVDFYKYSVPALTTERGIILATGETYSADITQDVVLYYKGSVLNQTLVVQQFS